MLISELTGSLVIEIVNKVAKILHQRMYSAVLLLIDVPGLHFQLVATILRKTQKIQITTCAQERISMA